MRQHGRGGSAGDQNKQGKGRHASAAVPGLPGGFQLVAFHIRGEHNSRADAVSRGRLRDFFTLHPQAEGQQTAVPAELVDLLLGSKPDWSSVNWTRQWCSCVPRDWQIPLDDLTRRLPRDTCSSVLKPVSPPSQ